MKGEAGKADNTSKSINLVSLKPINISHLDFKGNFLDPK